MSLIDSLRTKTAAAYNAVRGSDASARTNPLPMTEREAAAQRALQKWFPTGTSVTRPDISTYLKLDELRQTLPPRANEQMENAYVAWTRQTRPELPKERAMYNVLFSMLDRSLRIGD